jgi:hypothetical protein
MSEVKSEALLTLAMSDKKLEFCITRKMSEEMSVVGHNLKRKLICTANFLLEVSPW